MGVCEGGGGMQFPYSSLPYGHSVPEGVTVGVMVGVLEGVCVRVGVEVGV